MVFTVSAPASVALNANLLVTFKGASASGQVNLTYLKVSSRGLTVTAGWSATATVGGAGTITALIGSNAFQSGDLVAGLVTDVVSGSVATFSFAVSATSCWNGSTASSLYSATYATGGLSSNFQVGVDQPYIQVAQYDTNQADGNVNVYVSAIQGYSAPVDLYFQVVKIGTTNQDWGNASGNYTPATICFSNVDRATGQLLSKASAVVGDIGSGTIRLSPPDLCQLQITPSTDPAQAVEGNNTWQICVTAVNVNTGEWSTAAITVLVQAGCPYTYGISFQSSVVNNANITPTSGATSPDSAMMSPASKRKLFYVDGGYWLFCVYNFTNQGSPYKTVQWFTSDDGYTWNGGGDTYSFESMGLVVASTVDDDFWDVTYDPTYLGGSFVFALAIPQQAGTNIIDFPYIIPAYGGNLQASVWGGNHIWTALQVTGNHATKVSIASHNAQAYLAVNTIQTIAHHDIYYVEVWYSHDASAFGGGWTRIRNDMAAPNLLVGRGLVYYLFDNADTNVVLVEGSTSQPSLLTFYLTANQGSTWTSGVTTDTYVFSNGSVVPFQGSLFCAMPDSLGNDNYFSVAFTSGTPVVGTETPLTSGYPTTSISVYDAMNIYVALATSSSVVLTGTSDGGTTWTSLVPVSSFENGIVASSLHLTSSPFTDAITGHLMVGVAWIAGSGSVYSVRVAPVDLLNWPNIQITGPTISLVIEHGDTRTLTGFVYPIGKSVIPAGYPQLVLEAGNPQYGTPDHKYLLYMMGTGPYQVIPQFAGGDPTNNYQIRYFSQPTSVDSPTEFSVTITTPSSAPTGLTFPYTAIVEFLAFDTNLQLTGAPYPCFGKAYVVVHVV